MIKLANDVFILGTVLAGTLSLAPQAVFSQGPPSAGTYAVQAGDILSISLWKEPDLQQELLRRIGAE